MRNLSFWPTVLRASRTLWPGIRSWKERASVVSLCQTRNQCNPACSPEKMGSAPGGLCTTGLQDRDVSTIAAIISSISTASDFLESNGWGARYFLGPAGPPRPQIKLPYPLIFMGSPYTAMLSPQISHQATSMRSMESKATNVKSACSGWCLNEPRMNTGADTWDSTALSNSPSNPVTWNILFGSEEKSQNAKIKHGNKGCPLESKTTSFPCLIFKFKRKQLH